jgi:hypothetical protein
MSEVANMSDSASAALLVGALVLAACSRGQPPAPAGPAASEEAAEAPELGNVMVQVGHRFELAGKAMASSRFELAEFEVGELQEVFENDVPKAKLPKEGPTGQIRPMAKAFLEQVLPELTGAAGSKDKARFAVAFEHAATACNACHWAAAKGFIQVPTVPGQSVPVLDPVQAPAPSK